MTRKPGSARQQRLYRCKECGSTFKKHSNLVLHMKEIHGIEL
ncbi:MAG: C2H2-type zinc finger protein [Nitrosopumilus sp.]|nr:C2H2-type zinc finger protein [Nitrosopumilus sp.]